MHHNKRMNENELTILVQNEKEWRKTLWKMVEKTELRVRNLEVKNALFGSFFGAISGALMTYFLKR